MRERFGRASDPQCGGSIAVAYGGVVLAWTRVAAAPTARSMREHFVRRSAAQCGGPIAATLGSASWSRASAAPQRRLLVRWGSAHRCLQTERIILSHGTDPPALRRGRTPLLLQAPPSPFP